MARFIVEVNCRILVTRTVEVEADPDEDGIIDPLVVEEKGCYEAQSTGKRKDWSENSCWDDGEHHVTELKDGHRWDEAAHTIKDAQGNSVNMEKEYPDHGC